MRRNSIHCTKIDPRRTPLLHFAITRLWCAFCSVECVGSACVCVDRAPRCSAASSHSATRAASQCVFRSARGKSTESLRLHTHPTHCTCLQRALARKPLWLGWRLVSSRALSGTTQEKKTAAENSRQPCDLFCLFWVVGRVPHIFFATESWLRRQKLLLTSECPHANLVTCGIPLDYVFDGKLFSTNLYA